MCGIVGFVDFSGKLSEDFVSESLTLLHHRGPDDRGLYRYSQGHASLALGNTRLSIIDLSNKGHQPIESSCGNFVLTFNGTIYNFEELRARLIGEGVKFRSTSDTETLLESYIRWPESFLEKINGIFAFAIFDKLRNKVIIARDKVGVKPLFYYFDNRTFIFGSELKIFLKQTHFPKRINQEALNLYLQYAYFPAPHSIIEDVLKVRPGEVLTLDINTQNLEKSIFSAYSVEESDDKLGTVLERVEMKLGRSIKSRLVSDASVGVLLSGGYDSSAVAAIARRHSTEKLKTFTIGFKEKKYDEAPFAQQIAKHLNTDHHTLYFEDYHIHDIIGNLGRTFDEPMGDSGAVPLLLASKLAQPHVKVLLSAEGGDELFGGYNSYFKSLRVHKIGKWLPLPPGHWKNRYLHIFSQKNSLETYKAIVQYFTPAEAAELTGSSTYEAEGEIHSTDELNSMLLFDLHNYLPEDLLMKADRCMMHFSLENRDPMLDLDLIQYLGSLPAEVKCPNNIQKFLLKEIVHQYIPKELMDRPKKGFSIPVGSWLATNLRGFVQEKIESLSARKILDKTVIERIFKKFQSKPNSYRGRQIWVLLAFELWYEEWMN